MIEYLLLIGGWALYFTLHSVLAMDSVKAKFPPRVFRLFYVLISTAGLLALLFYNGSIHSLKFFVSDGPIRYVSLMLTTFGVMLIQSSFRQYSFKGFVGFGEEKKELRTDGVLQFVRHPILAGVILVTIGFFFFIPNLPTLISCACIMIYIPIGMFFEEKKLIAIYGDQYLEYKKKVPAIVPEKLFEKTTKN
ncbi:MAG TPA: isoprenylcysteine carboxylmethyltransferase family protein [Cyclobacteriaceae bacterium]|nr:isoprenylcysteine carboxylmethyltransferase family protein [Cyclobacteriaceae bacterium]